MSTLLRKLLLGSAALVCVNIVHAQAGPGTPPPPQPGAPNAAAPVDQPGSSGASAAPGSGASGAEVIVVPVVPIESHASNPATDGSNDPFIQRRKARARAKQEYEQRVNQAKTEYKQDKRDAKAEYNQEKRDANAELRAANPVTPNDRVNYGHGDMNPATSSGR